MPTISDLRVSPDGDRVQVYSELVRGRVATVWLDVTGAPRVSWALIPSYRAGIDEALVLGAVRASGLAN